MFCKMCILLFFLLCCLTNGHLLLFKASTFVKEMVRNYKFKTEKVKNLVNHLTELIGEATRVQHDLHIYIHSKLQHRNRTHKYGELLASEHKLASYADSFKLTKMYCNNMNKEIDRYKKLLEKCLKYERPKNFYNTPDLEIRWNISRAEWIHRSKVYEITNYMKQNYLREYLTAGEADKPKWIHFIEILLQIVDTVNLKDTIAAIELSPQTYDKTLIEALDFKAAIDPNWTSEDISSRRRRFQDVYRKDLELIKPNIRLAVLDATEWVYREAQAAESKKKTREMKIKLKREIEMSLETMLRFVDNEESNSRSVAKAALDLIKLSAKLQNKVRDEFDQNDAIRNNPSGMILIFNHDEKVKKVVKKFNTESKLC
eukprot:GHVL01005079.1.p1 GENE.GHVL01005079.1~~GHVL01005079.1.p1  ORF type:complete len:372 (+),score=48.01 GHVL01005079.1:25-1140(+)